MAFKPALLVVDMQNEWCSPRGSCPVSGNGMDLVPLIKKLLSTPGFAMRVAAMHEVPANHVTDFNQHEVEQGSYSFWGLNHNVVCFRNH